MKIRPIITGLLVLAAIGGIVFALTGEKDDVGEAAAEATANPGPGDRETSDPARREAQEVVAPDAAADLALQDELPMDGVVVYYFHGRQRCYTCNKMESLADAAVQETFADHLNEGTVAFRSVNIQTPENSHFGRDFELRSAGIVMVERRNGEQLRWHRLDEVWQKVRNDDAFKSYIVESLSAHLRELGLEKG